MSLCGPGPDTGDENMAVSAKSMNGAGLAPEVPEPTTDDTLSSTKVYWPRSEKLAFRQEALKHRQAESAYAKFILDARKDPLLFLQMCRLLHPGFAQGLAGNPADTARMGELETRTLKLEAEKADLLRQLEDAAWRRDELETQLAACADRAAALAGHVVSLARAQDANRDRAMAGGGEYEGVPKALVKVAKAARIAPATRAELETRLVEEGMSKTEASEAIGQAARLELIVRGRDQRYRLAKPPEEADE